MNDTIIKYLHWNLHAMGGKGYIIPDFITEHVELVDIFVLVEFRLAENWDKFKKHAETKFDLYCSPYVSKGYNQVCIGLSKNIDYKLHTVIAEDVCDVTIPEYLQVDIGIENKEISIIGTRIKTEVGDKQLQYQFLKSRLKGIDRFLCLGDFNCVHNTLQQYFSSIADVHGPRVTNNYHSFVFKNGNMQGLDWILSKGVTVYNGYSDKDKSPIATYDWSFISSTNGYGNKTKDEFLGIKGLPDHAILKGMIKL